MSFKNSTNATRVNKIVDTIALLQKSADSNEATSEEIWGMMERPLEAIGKLCDADVEAPEPVAKTTSLHKEAAWSSVMIMAREASLKDLTAAMAIYLNRIDEELS